MWYLKAYRACPWSSCVTAAVMRRSAATMSSARIFRTLPSLSKPTQMRAFTSVPLANTGLTCGTVGLVTFWGFLEHFFTYLGGSSRMLLFLA